MRVIAEAYGREPLDRLVAERRSSTFYLVNPRLANGGEVPKESGVGFPARYVFRFDSALFRNLSAAYASGDSRQLAELWKTATPVELEHA